MSRRLLKRDSDGATVDLDKEEAEQAHLTADAKRVVLVDADGDAINLSNPLPVNTEISVVGDLILEKVTEVNSDDILANLEAQNSLVPSAYDYISLSQTTTDDVYVFKLGGSGGTLVSTITITYTDDSKQTMASLLKS